MTAVTLIILWAFLGYVLDRLGHANLSIFATSTLMVLIFSSGVIAAQTGMKNLPMAVLAATYAVVLILIGYGMVQ